MSARVVSMDDMDRLQEDLNNVISWTNKNSMKLNEKKFELLCYRTKKSKYSPRRFAFYIKSSAIFNAFRNYPLSE